MCHEKFKDVQGLLKWTISEQIIASLIIQIQAIFIPLIRILSIFFRFLPHYYSMFLLNIAC